MKIRKYEEDDKQAVAELFADTVRSVNSQHYSDKQIDKWAADHIDGDFFHNEFEDCIVYVAEIEGQIVGFVSARPHRKLLHHLFVSKNHLRKGIAKKLCDKMEQTLRKEGLGEVFTDASITARPFFENYGFIPLEKQEVEKDGIHFVNYKMRKTFLSDEQSQAAD